MIVKQKKLFFFVGDQPGSRAQDQRSDQDSQAQNLTCGNSCRMKITLKLDGKRGDGKRAFVVAEENDGWKDLRIEVDTDDCDGKHAMGMIREVIKRCNNQNPK